MERCLSLSLIALLGAGCASGGGGKAPAQAAPGAVKHLVLLQWKPEATPQKVEEILAAFRNLPSRIPGIVSFESGRDMSTENLAKGFTQGAVITFRDRAARDAYLVHPEHEAFKQMALPSVADILVLDFEMGSGK